MHEVMGECAGLRGGGGVGRVCGEQRNHGVWGPGIEMARGVRG